MTSAATARTWSAPAGASTPTSGTRTRTCCSPRRTPAASGFGQVFSVDVPTGIRNPDGSFYRAGQPLSNIQSQNQVTAGAAPLFGQWVDPRLQQPWTRQTNAGWSHELMPNTIVNVDYVRSIGGDLNFRPRVNQRIPGHDHPPAGGAGANAQPERHGHPSGGQPRQQRVQRADPVGPPARCRNGLDFTASYTLSSGKSTIGNATDELNTANIQDPNNPFDDPRQFGPEPHDRCAAPLLGVGRLAGAVGNHRRAVLPVPLGAAGVPDRRARLEPATATSSTSRPRRTRDRATTTTHTRRRSKSPVRARR